MHGPRPDPILVDRVHSVLRTKIAEAEELYNQEFRYPGLVFTSRGSHAGRAQLENWKIELNTVLMNENGVEFVDSTVTHELAHLIDFKLNGIIRERRGRRIIQVQHGPTWKNIMVELGQDPSRCHNYDTSSVRRTKTRFEYKCLGCGHSLWLGARRHEKFQAGHANYWHRGCRDAGVEFVGKLPPNKPTTQHTSAPRKTSPSPAPRNGSSLRREAAAIFKQCGSERRLFIETCIHDLGMKQNTASTYHHNFKSGKWEV